MHYGLHYIRHSVMVMLPARAELEAKHPLGHLGEPDDVAFAELYLASEESKFATGTALVIDGGYMAQ